MQTMIFDISGMTDRACTAGVHRAIAKLDGVAYVDVCQPTGIVTILADVARVTPMQIETAIAGLGFSARVRDAVHLVRTPS